MEVVRIVAFEHVSEFFCIVIDDPKLVRAWNEFTVVVPAFYPCVFWFVQAEEASFIEFATLVFDPAEFLAHLVVRSQEISPQDLGIFDLDWRYHGNRFAFDLLKIYFAILC